MYKGGEREGVKLTSDPGLTDLDLEGLELGVVLDAGRFFDFDRSGVRGREEYGSGSEGGEGLHFEWWECAL